MARRHFVWTYHGHLKDYPRRSEGEGDQIILQHFFGGVLPLASVYSSSVSNFSLFTILFLVSKFFFNFRLSSPVSPRLFYLRSLTTLCIFTFHFSHHCFFFFFKTLNRRSEVAADERRSRRRRSSWKWIG